MENKGYYIGMCRKNNCIVQSDDLDFLENEHSVNIIKDCVGPFSEVELEQNVERIEKALEIYFENDPQKDRKLPIDFKVFYNLMVVVNNC